ncbi:MAG: AraC family transcriptional regulator [Pedobacter sp.]|nr:AraC family transcriptional regulator [Pedobacter sp.]
MVLPRNRFFIIGILVLAIFNFFYTLNYSDIHTAGAPWLWSPTWLLYGPFLYFSVRNDTQNGSFRPFLYHLIPAILFFAGYSLLPDQWSEGYDQLFFIVPLTMACYVFVLLPTLKKRAMQEEDIDLFILLTAFYASLILMCSVRFVCINILKLSAGVNYNGYINYVLMAMVIITIAFLFSKRKEQLLGGRDLQLQGYAKSSLKAETVAFYIKKIEEHFREEQAFLQYNITLDSLSRQLSIPKPHLTQVFNKHLKKNFYGYLATYRIEYALILMQQHNFTIEALAHECGFSSKTSFNNHFKAITGLTPTVYLNQRNES